jgi:hypothetical protein
MAFAAATLTGCAINEPNDPEEYKPSSELSFTTDVDVPVKAGTRGTPINDEEDMTTMGVFASYTGTSDWTAEAPLNKMFNKQLNYSGGEWEYLPGEGVQWNAQTVVDRYSFFAYAPYADTANGITVLGASGDAGIPTLTYTVPEDVTKQPDLMVATKKNVRPSGAKVQLDMKHALTSVGFQIVAEDSGKKLTGISITGVSVSGTVAMDGETIAWGSFGAVTESDFSASLAYDSGKDYYTVPTGTAGSPVAGNGYLMMIPQTLTSAAKVTMSFDGEADRTIDLGTHMWEAGDKVTYSITLTAEGVIIVGPTSVSIPYIAGVGGNFSVTCQMANGDPAPTLPWSFSVPASIDWLRLSTSATATWATATTTVSGMGSSTIYLVATENTSTTTTRSTKVTLAGAGDEVAVTQGKTPSSSTDNTPSGIVGTVGAFWKKDQTGERIVTIPTTTSTYAGDWTAQVVYYGTGFSAGDILMVAGDSEDATSIAADTYTDPESRQVSAYPTAAQAIAGTATTASGIKFRIFMKEEWDGTSPRYAKIAVNFGNTGQYTRFIYVRQGEQDDYLMRPGDAGTAVGTRDLAAKFSPYNLTDPDFTGLTGSTAQRGSTVTPQSEDPTTSDVFTDYPSQAGAFYKWAETAGVVAYNPAVPNSAAVTGWVSSNNVTANWDVEIGTTGNTPRDLYEGCPTGYRRFTDGSTSSNVTISSQGASNSEMGQSLFENPVTGATTSNTTGNSVWGYYSDGWFDRFTPGQQTANSSYTGSNNAAVSRDNSTVAYQGRLFYNPVAASSNYNASLFFPAPGGRYNSNGYLYGPGTNGGYWSSSATSGSYGVNLYVSSSNAYRDNSYRSTGFSVRCVVAE